MSTEPIQSPEGGRALTTCNCRWDGDQQVQQCTLHQAHVDTIHEWAERAKAAEKDTRRLDCLLNDFWFGGATKDRREAIKQCLDETEVIAFLDDELAANPAAQPAPACPHTGQCHPGFCPCSDARRGIKPQPAQSPAEGYGALRRLIASWREGTEDRENESGYARGVDFAFAKAARDLEQLLDVQPKGTATGKLKAVYGDKWEGAEEWMPLAWELCANECGEDACTELIWEGGPIPEPWGDRWLKYEDRAKEMIAMVRASLAAAQAHAPAQPKVTPAELTDEQIDEIAKGWVMSLGGDHWYSGERGIKDDSDLIAFARQLIAADRALQATAVGAEQTPAGYNRPPNGEPRNTDDWNAGYEAGLADGRGVGSVPVAWMYEHDGSLDEPILTASRWPECHEPWNETPLDALALAKHAIEKVWLDAVGTGHGEHSISEAARARVEFAAEALKLGLRLPGALRNTGVESPTKENS